MWQLHCNKVINFNVALHLLYALEHVFFWLGTGLFGFRRLILRIVHKQMCVCKLIDCAKWKIVRWALSNAKEENMWLIAIFIGSYSLCQIGGHSTFFGLLNTFVHIVMYSYYLFSALGERYQKFLWWKKYLTALQMVCTFRLLFFIRSLSSPILWCLALTPIFESRAYF